MQHLANFRTVISRHARIDGIHASCLPGVSLLRSSTPTMPMPVVYEPTLCLVAQGRKQVSLGGVHFVYDAANYLIASVQLPVTGAVIEASEQQPFLCLRLNLSMAVLTELVLQLKIAEPAHPVRSRALILAPASSALFDAAARLVGLLDAPADAAVLEPLITREIMYRLISGPDGALLRQLTHADSRLAAISRAIAWLRKHYSAGCRIEEMAEVAHMSRSTFHLHFKSITSMSPLEFRSQLRLHEARRLMVADGLDAAQAGYIVGYQSPSQFGREYARTFGAPPARDALRQRAVSKSP